MIVTRTPSRALRARSRQARAVHCRSSSNQQTAYESLDRAVQTLNKFISAGAGDGPKALPQDAASTSTRRPKVVQFSSATSMTKTVEDAASPAKSLQSYLALPIDEYSLLDPQWIQRGDADGTFQLQVPLYDLVGIDLTPGVTIQVEVDEHQSQVKFTATEFSTGEASLDTEFTVNMLAVLNAGDSQEVRITKRGSQGSSPGGAYNEIELLQTLQCSVKVDGSVNVPHPLSIAPRPLLASLGSLVLRLVLQSLLPNFLELLLVDYRRWVAGSRAHDKPAGNLISQ